MDLGSTPTLFTPAIESRGFDEPDRIGVLRSRSVSVNLEPTTKLNVDEHALLELHLFDDASFTGVIQRREERAPDDYTIVGSLVDEPLGQFVLVVKRGIMVGTIRVPNYGSFRILPTREGTHLIEEIDDGELGRCGTGFVRQDEPSGLAASAAGQPPCTSNDDGSVIDIMVLYTRIARQAAGSQAIIEAKIEADIAAANSIYQNSRVNPRLRLVLAAEVLYDEDGTINQHRDRLVDPNDGVMDNIHWVRDAYGADTVSLYYNSHTDRICRNGSNNGTACVTDSDCTGGGVCRLSFTGLSRTMLQLSHAQEAQAFNVVKWDSSDWVLAHEVGHTQGCAHDRDNPQRGSLYPYSWGRRYLGNTRNGVCVAGGVGGDACSLNADCPSGSECIEWRTLMAYSPGSVIPYFSNATAWFDGSPTGVPVGQSDAADNARTIDETALVVSNFRTSLYWVDFDYGGPELLGCFWTPFNTLASAVDAVPIDGTVRLFVGSTDESITLAKKMRIESWGGAAVIGRRLP